MCVCMNSCSKLVDWRWWRKKMKWIKTGNFILFLLTHFIFFFIIICVFGWMTVVSRWNACCIIRLVVTCILTCFWPFIWPWPKLYIIYHIFFKRSYTHIHLCVELSFILSDGYVRGWTNEQMNERTNKPANHHSLQFVDC